MNENIALLAALFLSHILGDFYFQPTSWVTDRLQSHFKSKSLYYHCLVHGFLVFLTLIILNKAPGQIVGGSLFILISHFFIDLLKSYKPKNLLYFSLDQIMHMLFLLLLWLYLAEGTADILVFLKAQLNYQFLTIIGAYLIILNPCAIIIKMLLDKWSNFPAGKNSLASAGRLIGMVERVLILTFVLLNQFTGIGFLLAAKSVFRFGDLKHEDDHKMTEYVMLGTLLSVTATIIVGLIASLIITQN